MTFIDGKQAPDRIWAYLGERKKWRTASEVAEACEVHRKTALRILKDFVLDGKLAMMTRHPKPAVWRRR